MLKVRVIPTLLINGPSLVKGLAFDSRRRVGSPLPAIRVYNLRDVDELLLLDVSATREGRPIDFESIAEFSKSCFIPFTVGGGITRLEDAQRLLRSGADKVSINSASYSNPAIIEEIAKQYGSQCVVASVDVRREGDRWICYSHSGTCPVDKEMRAWIKELEQRGAGEILITSIDRDGTMSGYDLDLIEAVSSLVSIPVIASGGAGSTDDPVRAVKDAGASAISAASIFHFTQITPRDIKLAMAKNMIPVRL